MAAFHISRWQCWRGLGAFVPPLRRVAWIQKTVEAKPCLPHPKTGPFFHTIKASSSSVVFFGLPIPPPPCTPSLHAIDSTAILAPFVSLLVFLFSSSSSRKLLTPPGRSFHPLRRVFVLPDRCPMTRGIRSAPN